MEEITLTKESIGLDRVSPSSLDCYESCPRLFYYQNWLGLKIDQDKMHMDFGTAIHNAMEEMFLKYDNHFGGAWEGAEFDDVEKTFTKSWKINHIPEASFQKFLTTRAGKESGFTKREELYEYMKEDGLIMLKSYWDNKELFLIDHGYDLREFEVPLRVEMHNPKDPEDKLPIPLSGRIDAISEGRKKMVDFKTSKSKYDEIETRKKIQGISYVFGMLMLTGEFIPEFDYIILRKDLKSPDRIEVVKLVYDKADMVAFYYRVKAILTKIAMREFDRPSLGHPRYCQCYTYDEVLSVKDIELLKTN